MTRKIIGKVKSMYVIFQQKLLIIKKEKLFNYICIIKYIYYLLLISSTDYIVDS